MPYRSPPALSAPVSVCLILAALVATSVWAERNAGPGLLPHGFCFTWLPSLLWLHVVSDGLTALAYFSIPIGLWRLARRRADLPFHWMFLLFGTFIVACGTTHLLGIWNVWVPDYWLSGAVKAITAAASVPTAIALFILLPRAIELPSTAQLHEANDALRREVAMRRAAEADLLAARAGLEARVEARTRELAEATDRARLATAQAESANRSKDEFIAMLSHELRNPMAPIANAHRLIERTQRLDETGRAALAMAVRQGTQLRRLVDDLLDATRIAQGKFALQPIAVDVADAVMQVVQGMQPLARERSQPFEVSVAADVGAVRADPARLQQVLENLLSNAFKFTDPKDAVRLRVDSDAHAVRIEVGDDGIGIDAASLPRVFDLFVQGDTTIDRSRGGLGIGLAWVKAIVEVHGGTVSVHSAGRGRGTTFTVTLPRGGPGTPPAA
ncbi:MAG: sensor histidine kinase [Burkholderiales bacterium]|nr:MAG: sensor histidine kinase [Burkholderiales bacterium]